MTVDQIKDKILSDKEFVEHEIETLLSYYQLKHTIRWAHARQEDETESVAEHIFGLHLLVDYFYPLVVEAENINLEKVRHLATWHDMAEAFVGDMTTKMKTADHERKEKEAEAQIVINAPAHLADMLRAVYDEYDVRQTLEAKFTKALDKLEPLFHLYFLSTKPKEYLHHFSLGWTAEEYREHRRQFVNEFPIIKRFDDVLSEKVTAAGFHNNYSN